MDTMTNKELKRARVALGLTQKGLGLALDYHKNTVARMERNEMPISKTTELSVKYLVLVSKKRGRT